MSRLPVQKTLKLYVGGKFIRSESGRVVATRGKRGEIVNVCATSKKDLRGAMETARGAQRGWEAATAYNRGQILHRLAEMLEDRLEVLPTTREDAEAAIDRVVHHAGWTDKWSAVLSTLNPVSQAYVNYSRLRPVGVVVAVPDPKDGLLGMVEAVCAALVPGNAVMVLVPLELAEIATALAEALATSDLPGGVANILTANVEEALGHAVRHNDLDALYVARGAISQKALTDAQTENALVLRRLLVVEGATSAAGPLEMQQLAEVQTVWMSGMELRGGGAAY